MDADAMADRIAYDEFGLFHENAEEYGLPYDGPPVVRREHVELGDGRRLSALVWGDAPAEVVLLHGGAQNAHTWDTVAMTLGRPLVAIDLPGHGHSDGGRNGSLDLAANAADTAAAITTLAPEAKAVVGMSLGGLTALTIAGTRPELVRSLVMIDVTPGVDDEKAAAIIAFVNGPESFADFDEILARTIQFNPTRSESSLRRGILHNAEQRQDGSWVWRHARHRAGEPSMGEAVEQLDRTVLWDMVAGLTMPVMLVRGMATGSVVTDDDEERFRSVQPSVRVERVEGAGHSVQGDKPVELAALLADWLS